MHNKLGDIGTALFTAQCVRGKARSLTGFAIAALGSLALAGCGLSSLSGLGSGIFGGGSSATPEVTADAAGGVNEAQLLTAAKAESSATGSLAGDDINAGCPKIVVGARDNNLTIYEAGRAGDGLAIVHRSEITKTARECQIEPGRVTVKYGFSGRVLLGPRGKSGPVSLPINVTVTDAKRAKVMNGKVKIDTSLAIENPIGFFSTVQTVTINIPEGSRPGEFEINLGFDRTVPGAG